VTQHETSVLGSRLHQLADDLTPPLDVSALVREARLRNRTQRRARITLIAVATATAGVVVGTAAAVDVLSASPDGQAADPGGTTSTPTTSAPIETVTPSPPPAAEATGAALPAGWEARTFMGATFGVPPGSTEPDSVLPYSIQGDSPAYAWLGPALEGSERQLVNIRIDSLDGTFSHEGNEAVAVPGAIEAYATVAPEPRHVDAPDVTALVLDARTADGVVHVSATFPAGPIGEQMGRDLIASLDLTEMDTSPGTLSNGRHFVLLYYFDPDRGLMTLETADQGAEGRTWSCTVEAPVMGTSTDVRDICSGDLGEMQTIAVTATTFSLSGPPSQVVGSADFEVKVLEELWRADGLGQPMRGVIDVVDGQVVAFEEVPGQSD
jgi:hypothetical protein